jgi:solute carrier family 35 protein F5
MTYFIGFAIFPSWRQLWHWKPQPGKPTILEIAMNGLAMCPLWFGANIAFNYSLSYTSVSSNTILSSTSSFFTFLLSFLFRIDGFSITRIASILIAFSGVILVTTTDRNSGTDSLIGPILSLTGAVMYGSYTTFMKSRVSEEYPSQVLLLFAFVGFFNFLLMWPMFLIVHYTGLEPFEVPSIQVVGFLILNGSIGTVLSDVFWSLGVLLTSPVACTVGLSLSIPFSMLTDILLGKNTRSFGIQYLIGSIFVIIGFILVNISYYFPKDLMFFDTMDCIWQKSCIPIVEGTEVSKESIPEDSIPILHQSEEVLGDPL